MLTCWCSSYKRNARRRRQLHRSFDSPPISVDGIFPIVETTAYICASDDSILEDDHRKPARYLSRVKEGVETVKHRASPFRLLPSPPIRFSISYRADIAGAGVRANRGP